MSTDNLNIPEVSASQSQKEVTINEGLNALDVASNSELAVAVTGTSDEVSTTDFFTFSVFRLTGTPGAPFTLTLPDEAPRERTFAVVNESDDTVTLDSGGSTVDVDAGEAALLHSDGTNVRLIASSTGGGGGGGGSTTLTENAQTGTAYTLVLGDAPDVVVSLSNVSAITLTVPSNSTAAIPVGSYITIWQKNIGQVEVVGEGGVTVEVPEDSSAFLRGENSFATLYKTGTNTWQLFGDLATDGVIIEAENVGYDNMASGLTADQVQDAIDEIVQNTVPSATGTFTPSVAFATPGDSSFTYGRQNGYYTRLGNRCFFDIDLQFTTNSYTTAAGALSILGLPFVSLDVNPTPGFSANISGVANVDYGASSAIQLAARVNRNASTITLLLIRDSNTGLAAGVDNFPPGTTFSFLIGGSFIVA